MTNSRSSAEPPADNPSDGITMPPKDSLKPRRTGSRRVSSPAGAPAQTSSAASALLIVGADGMIVTQASSTDADDGATRVDAEPAPVLDPELADHGTGDHAEDHVGDQAETEDRVEPEFDAEAGAAAAAHMEPEFDAEAGAAAAAAAAAHMEAPEATEVPDTSDAQAPAEAPSLTVPEEGSGPTKESKDSGDSLGLGPDVEAAPASRRERRIAEQKVLDGVVPARAVRAPVAPALGEPPAPRPDPQPGGLPKRRSNSWSFLRGFLLFTVIAAVVVGMGTVIPGQSTPTDGPSATEIARQHAWVESKTLLTMAQSLGGAAPHGDPQDVLKSTAADLEVQIAALADGLPTPSARPDVGATSSATSSATAQGLATALAANANNLLAAAVSAEGSMGRVFAAVGTSQLLQSTAISLANGMPAPSSPFLPTAADQGPSTAPRCNTLLKPQPGISSDAALLAAADGEQKAVFAYQVSTTRLAEPNFSKSVEFLAGHEQRLVLLNRELSLRCLPQVAPVPGFVLDASFTAAPKKALADLEGQLAVLYGDVAALSKPPRDAAAVQEAGTQDSTYTASTSQLRELSVRWLLGSAFNQQFWGGTVGPLPGIADAVPAVPATGAANSGP